MCSDFFSFFGGGGSAALPLRHCRGSAVFLLAVLAACAWGRAAIVSDGGPVIQLSGCCSSSESDGGRSMRLDALLSRSIGP